jgi:uncharacterized protein (TIGR00296 family)
MKYSLKDGTTLVKFTRKILENYFKEKSNMPKLPAKFSEKCGVFVTLMKNNKLRGCIGYVEPTMPLAEAVREAAVWAANDPRFPRLTQSELDEVVCEVTILSVPKELKGERKEFPKKIIIGKHGLMIQLGIASGLLLPQVAVDEKMTSEDFLSAVCWKAGLEPSAWLDPQARIWTFEGQIFEEEKPKGKVIERKIQNSEV